MTRLHGSRSHGSEDLLVELKVIILHNLADIASLKSSAHTSALYNRPFLTQQHGVLVSTLSREHSSLLLHNVLAATGNLNIQHGCD